MTAASPNPDPSRRDVVVFGLLLAGLGPLLVLMLLRRPGALLAAGAFTGACGVLSLLANRSVSWRMHLWGLVMPASLLALGAAATWGGRPAALAAAASAAAGCALGATVALTAPAWGRRLYRGWMDAAAPVAWTVTHVALALVYGLVFTPTGWIMRLLGRDAMRRRFDPAATTYWTPRPPTPGVSRYFRQF